MRAFDDLIQQMIAATCVPA